MALPIAIDKDVSIPVAELRALVARMDLALTGEVQPAMLKRALDQMVPAIIHAARDVRKPMRKALRDHKAKQEADRKAAEKYLRAQAAAERRAEAERTRAALSAGLKAVA